MSQGRDAQGAGAGARPAAECGNHNVRFCQKATSCRICKRRHHSLLHPKDVSTSTANPESVVQAAETGSGEATHIATENTQNESTPIVNCFATGIVQDEVLLATALVKAESKTGEYQCTTLGWILSGTDGSTSVHDTVTVLHTQVNEDDQLKRFWEIEAEPNVHSKLLTKEEQRCEDLFASTTVRTQEGRYVVKLPFRDDHTCKGNSREIAVKRLRSLERKLEKDKTLKARYTEVIQEYEQLGHMILVTEPDHKKREAIYLPHHAVAREDKSTTKVRVVFDASCKYDEGISLNDQLMTGPTLQPELRHLIMRWRRYPVCLVADIVKMYRMVRVANEDTDFQRIVWRENAEDEIKDYKLLTVTFGTASAPYLAVKALNQVACDHREQYPIAAPRVHQEFYMDDLMTGCQTEEEGLQLYREMKGLLNEGRFVLQKWASNKKELSKQINRREGENLGNKEEKSNLEIKTDNITKILGLTWNRDDDEFQYSVKLPPLSPPEK
ncbi:uncharacterized protein LOC134753727 [Cydia strobilella]|uniref:uncharacterized protein LOC134753727 n=1 Tax=Cydia strobilella TaxID=1100964 RepID=UPI003007DFA2